MKWIEILLNAINDYSLVLILILSITNIVFALFGELREKKGFKITAASISILILLFAAIAAIFESKNVEKHYSTAINTLINTDNLIEKAQRNNQLINDNLLLSKDLSDKTSEVSTNTLKIFEKLTDKDSYCYIDVNPFWHPVKLQQKISFCIKHMGNYAISNVNITIQNTSKAFCLKTIYHTMKEWALIENLTTSNFQFPVVYSGTEMTFDYNLTPELKIPNDTAAFNFVGENRKTENMFDKLCGDDYITLQANIFTPNKTLNEIIIVENYSNLKKRKISITVRDKGKILKQIDY